jgi:ATP-dependent Clp protease ATP-binding subunit ClpA
MDWSRFTGPARRVIFTAFTIAKENRARSVSTEHFLLALLKDCSPIVEAILKENCTPLMFLKAEIVLPKVEKDEPAFKGDMPLSSFVESVLHEAAYAARVADSNFTNTGHIFLGLLRAPTGVARQILENHGFDYNRARDIVLEHQASESIA